LRGRSVRGGLATVTAQGLKFVLNLGSTAVLARLLTPDDFGLVAMVAAVVGFAALFKDLGLSMATVQRETITHEQVSTLFWVNLAFSVLLALVVAAASPLVALLYGEPRLVAITAALGATFVFGGLAAQHVALLQRRMRFTAVASIELASFAVSIGVAIAVAYAFRTYWALVAMTATQAVCTALFAWIASGWLPGLPRRDAEVRSMLAFGGNLTGFNILNYFTRNADNVLVGAVLGAGPLGFYSRAYNLLMLPIRQVNTPLTAVALPALSRLQTDAPAYRRFFLRAVGLAAMFTAPIVLFAFTAADDIVLLVLGRQWVESTTIFRLLMPAALVGAINMVPGWLCVSLGRAGVQFRWALWSAPFVVAGFAVGLLWGAEGVAASFSCTFTVALIAFVMMAAKGSPVSSADILRAVARAFFAAFVASAGVFAMRALLDFSAVHLILRLAIFGAAYSILYLAVFCGLPGGVQQIRATLELRNSLRTAKA
ncbi:MAG: lipopolysaccharide biosynthesis protein, partial [Phycisphaerales bacterium]